MGTSITMMTRLRRVHTRMGMQRTIMITRTVMTTQRTTIPAAAGQCCWATACIALATVF
jgi:hypothetical protein